MIAVSSPIWPEAPASSSALQVRSNLDLVYDDEEPSVVVFRVPYFPLGEVNCLQISGASLHVDMELTCRCGQ